MRTFRLRRIPVLVDRPLADVVELLLMSRLLRAIHLPAYVCSSILMLRR